MTDNLHDNLSLTLPPLCCVYCTCIVIGIGNFGCYAHVALRRALCAMFWVDEADHQIDFEIDRLDPNSATMALAMYRRDQKNRRGIGTTPSLGIYITTS